MKEALVSFAKNKSGGAYMNKEDAVKFHKDFFDAMRSTGFYPGDDMCCRILAWVLVYGGGREEVIFNTHFNADIMAAQKRLNIYSEEVPNVTLLPVLQGYIKELRDYDNPPEWVYDLERKYQLRNYRREKIT